MIRINRRLSSEISRRVALEQELRSSEYHYRGLVESLSAIAWEASITDFTYSYASPHAEDLLGYPRAALADSGLLAQHHSPRRPDPHAKPIAIAKPCATVTTALITE